MKEDSFYFPHDINSDDDEKMIFLIDSLGNKGVGLYWRFIQKMHASPDGKLNKRLLSGFVSRFGEPIATLQKFYGVAIASALFCEDDEKFWSERVLRNKQLREEKREAQSNFGRKGAYTRWGKDGQSIATPKPLYKSRIGSDGKGKERKGNKKESVKSKSTILESVDNSDRPTFLKEKEEEKLIKFKLSTLEVKHDKKILNLEEKYEIFLKYQVIYDRRGWNLEILESVMRICAEKLQKYSDVEKVYPYYESMIKRYTDENAELLAAQNRKYQKT